METGIKKEKYFIVKETESAKDMGSGDLEVLATPILVAYFENVSKDLVTPYLTEGDTTVGINININHLAPSKIGNQILIKVNFTDNNDIVLDGDKLTKDFITLKNDKRIHAIVVNIRRN